MCIWRQCNKDPSAALGMTVLGERIGSQGWCAACLEDGILVSQPSPCGEGLYGSGFAAFFYWDDARKCLFSNKSLLRYEGRNRLTCMVSDPSIQSPLVLAAALLT